MGWGLGVGVRVGVRGRVRVRVRAVSTLVRGHMDGLVAVGGAGAQLAPRAPRKRAT